MQRLIGLFVLLVAVTSLTACGSSDSGAAGVRERLSGISNGDIGVSSWSDSKLNRFGAKVCKQFPNGVWGDPRVSGTESDSPYVAYAGHPKPQWITWMAPWIWQDFYDAYCSHS